VSELETHFLKARKLALGIVSGQIGIALLVSAAGSLLGGPRASVSAIVGGGIGALASLVMVVSTFRLSASVEPARILRRVYRAELYKFVITVGLFSLVFLNMDVSFGAMLGGFVATLSVYWVALGVRLPQISPGP
jgi:F0F1-type ATP synthase assembly protein I